MFITGGPQLTNGPYGLRNYHKQALDGFYAGTAKGGGKGATPTAPRTIIKCSSFFLRAQLVRRSGGGTRAPRPKSSAWVTFAD